MLGESLKILSGLKQVLFYQQGLSAPSKKVASQPLMEAQFHRTLLFWLLSAPPPLSLNGVGSPLLGKGSCVYNVATEGDLSSVRIESMESHRIRTQRESPHSFSSKVTLAGLIEGRNLAPRR